MTDELIQKREKQRKMKEFAKNAMSKNKKTMITKSLKERKEEQVAKKRSSEMSKAAKMEEYSKNVPKPKVAAKAKKPEIDELERR